MVNQPIEFQGALTSHYHLKRSMDLPLFHADASKDTTTRVDTIAEIIMCNDERKVNEPISVLREELRPG